MSISFESVHYWVGLLSVALIVLALWVLSTKRAKTAGDWL